MFSDEIEKLSWNEITEKIHSKTANDVRRALRNSITTLD